MRILVVHPGADTSTSDVHDGLVAALRRAGHETIAYELGGRILQAGSWLRTLWKRNRKHNPDLEKPNAADVVYHANSGILERVVRFQPDMVLIISSMWCPPDSLILLRRMGCYVGVVLTESPYDDARQEKVAALANVVWTNERASVEPFRKINPNTFYLRHAYDPECHTREHDAEYPDLESHDVVFVGTAFQERIEVLQSIDWDGIDLGLYGNWEMLGSRSKLRQYVRADTIPNAVTSELYRRAKIGLNLHRSSMGFGRDAPRIEHAESLNPRAFELAATGCFHVSDERAELREIFGDLIPTFSNPRELGDLVRRYLADDAARAAIAQRLPFAVAAETFDARVQQIVSDIALARS